MLVLNRKPNQTVVINDNIRITIVRVRGNQVRLGFSAPEHVTIHRGEIYAQIQSSDKENVTGLVTT